MHFSLGDTMPDGDIVEITLTVSDKEKCRGDDGRGEILVRSGVRGQLRETGHRLDAGRLRQDCRQLAPACGTPAGNNPQRIAPATAIFMMVVSVATDMSD